MSKATKGQKEPVRHSVGFVIDWAVRLRLPSAPLKLLLVVMALEANSNGICECPVRWLADHCTIGLRHCQKLLLTLRDLGLITIVDLAPGTEDRSRLFALQITIDPDLWKPNDESYATQQLKGLTTDTFHARIIQELQKISKPTDVWGGAATMNDYRTFISPVRVISIAAKRLVLRVPDKETANKVFTTYKELILKVAAELSERELKKIQVIHPHHKA